MSTMNIAGLTPVEDPSYRYKMPKVIGKNFELLKTPRQVISS
jgi:hypothetical protein